MLLTQPLESQSPTARSAFIRLQGYDRPCRVNVDLHILHTPEDIHYPELSAQSPDP